jgi:catechol 2,3-dioxygenase-like lactoylglutathione lyase family enzyme
MFHKNETLKSLACLLVFCLCAGMARSQSNKPSTPAAQPQKKETPVKFNKITPNLMVADMEKSLKFYRDVLGFTVSQTVPEKPPFIFAWMKRGDAELFLNQHMPPQPGQPDLYNGSKLGGTLSMYMPLEGIEELHKTMESNGVKIAIPLHKEFYGMKEFAVHDPDGYLIIFAERAE